MDKITCVIVEDEIPSAEELKFILASYNYLELIGMAHDGESALEIIKKLEPDVVFMDINIPVINGVELAGKVKELKKETDIVFITAYEEHALKAFEINAVDYVLKPFDEERIDLTVNRLKSKRLDKKEKWDLSARIDEIIEKLDNKKNMLRKIPCEFNGKIILIPADDVYFCYIEDNKTYVKTRNTKYYTGYTLYEIEDKTNFFRVHRSYLVNMDNVKELYSWFNGTYMLVMDDEEKSEVPISRNNVKKFKETLGI